MMLKEEGNLGGWARPCDSCRAAAAAVYCRPDSAYLCAGCDARVHAASRAASRHDRVWVCEACERAPAALTCKADAAALCSACDARIHSANPLARRHHRVPVAPIPAGAAAGRLAGPSPLLGHHHLVGGGEFPLGGGLDDEAAVEEDGEDEAASWLLLNPVKSSNQSNNNYNSNSNSNNNGLFLFGGEVDEYLDLVEYNPGMENQNEDDQQQQQSHGKGEVADRDVPVQQCCFRENKQQQQQQQLKMESEASKAGFSHSVSMSSVDASVVPDVADITNSQCRPSKGTIDLFAGPPLPAMPPQFTHMDREARVLRYREKRKNRKFEKTIRYASRKAYAETRPRIKGRFAKRSDAAEEMFAPTVMAESSYGIVPSF